MAGLSNGGHYLWLAVWFLLALCYVEASRPTLIDQQSTRIASLRLPFQVSDPSARVEALQSGARSLFEENEGEGEQEGDSGEGGEDKAEEGADGEEAATEDDQETEKADQSGESQEEVTARGCSIHLYESICLNNDFACLHDVN
jgi:hypothetical protein